MCKVTWGSDSGRMYEVEKQMRNVLWDRDAPIKERDLHYGLLNLKMSLCFHFASLITSVRPCSSLVNATGRRKMHNVFRDS